MYVYIGQGREFSDSWLEKKKMKNSGIVPLGNLSRRAIINSNAGNVR